LALVPSAQETVSIAVQLNAIKQFRLLNWRPDASHWLLLHDQL
jgi:hypothetical protein